MFLKRALVPPAGRIGTLSHTRVGTPEISPSPFGLRTLSRRSSDNPWVGLTLRKQKDRRPRQVLPVAPLSEAESVGPGPRSGPLLLSVVVHPLPLVPPPRGHQVSFVVYQGSGTSVGRGYVPRVYTGRVADHVPEVRTSGSVVTGGEFLFQRSGARETDTRSDQGLLGPTDSWRVGDGEYGWGGIRTVPWTAGHGTPTRVPSGRGPGLLVFESYLLLAGTTPGGTWEKVERDFWDLDSLVVPSSRHIKKDSLLHLFPKDLLTLSNDLISSSPSYVVDPSGPPPSTHVRLVAPQTLGSRVLPSARVGRPGRTSTGRGHGGTDGRPEARGKVRDN